MDQLDQHIPKAFVTSGTDLNDPKARHQLMLDAGRRDLVDTLLSIRRRAKERE